jgi:hypothetical protein
MWPRNFVNEEALAHWGDVAPKTNNQKSMASAKSIFAQPTITR